MMGSLQIQHFFCRWLPAGRWFSLDTPVSSSNDTDISEILLKVVLNTITITLHNSININKVKNLFKEGTQACNSLGHVAVSLVLCLLSGM
jgi:hypothetical protein